MPRAASIAGTRRPSSPPALSQSACWGLAVPAPESQDKVALQLSFVHCWAQAAEKGKKRKVGIMRWGCYEVGVPT